ncbi:MAG: ArsR/SmtB family transcription factor [Promethearchaeota archaeon]
MTNSKNKDLKTKIADFLTETSSKCKVDEFLLRLKDKVAGIKANEDFRKELELHKMLSSEIRLLIYNLIKDEPLCTCAISGILGLSEATISHHIKKLEKGGLIIGKREGRFTVYYSKEKFIEIIGL